MSSDSPINNQRPDAAEQHYSSQNYSISGRIMLASVITLFVVVIFLILLHLYSRWYLHSLSRRNHTGRHPNRMVYYVDNNRPLASPTGGLDASVLKSLPLFVYSPETDANLPECAVCLSEFEQGETGRVLPNCKHSFHTGCIDMWFCSNSTCPLCRSPVEPVEPVSTEHEPGSSTSRSFPAQHWAELMETTSSLAERRKRVDVRIDVPNRNESVSENEFRSPGSRLLSLKRIINIGRRSPVVSPSSGVGPSCVPAVGESDIESASQETDYEASRLETVGENYENGHTGGYR